MADKTKYASVDGMVALRFPGQDFSAAGAGLTALRTALGNLGFTGLVAIYGTADKEVVVLETASTTSLLQALDMVSLVHEAPTKVTRLVGIYTSIV